MGTVIKFNSQFDHSLVTSSDLGVQMASKIVDYLPHRYQHVGYQHQDQDHLQIIFRNIINIQATTEILVETVCSSSKNGSLSNNSHDFVKPMHTVILAPQIGFSSYLFISSSGRFFRNHVWFLNSRMVLL